MAKTLQTTQRAKSRTSPKDETKDLGKPISLYPLSFDEALGGLLEVKPVPKNKQQKEKKKRGRRKNEQST